MTFFWGELQPQFSNQIAFDMYTSIPEMGTRSKHKINKVNYSAMKILYSQLPIFILDSTTAQSSDALERSKLRSSTKIPLPTIHNSCVPVLEPPEALPQRSF